MSPRATIMVVYACFGSLIGLWGGAVAEVSRLAGADAAAQGIAITVFGVAGIIGMAFGGRIAVAMSVRMRLVACLVLEALALFALLHSASTVALVAGILFFSMFAAAADLAMNAEGLAVERDHGRPTLSLFHGIASFGNAFGAIAGSWLTVRHGPGATALVAGLFVAIAITGILRFTPDRGPTESASGGSTWFKPTTALFVIAVIVGVSIACEIGTMQFSTQTLTAQAPALAAVAGAAGMIYSLLQGTVRLGGDHLRARFGDRGVLRGSLVALFAGLVVVTTSGGPAQSLAGFALVGAGTASLVPCGFALAARWSSRSASATISLISVIGGPFRIVGPSIYGAIAAQAGYAAGYGIYAAMALAAAAAAFILLEKPAKEATT